MNINVNMKAFVSKNKTTECEQNKELRVGSRVVLSSFILILLKGFYYTVPLAECVTIFIHQYISSILLPMYPLSLLCTCPNHFSVMQKPINKHWK